MANLRPKSVNSINAWLTPTLTLDRQYIQSNAWINNCIQFQMQCHNFYSYSSQLIGLFIVSNHPYSTQNPSWVMTCQVRDNECLQFSQCTPASCKSTLVHQSKESKKIKNIVKLHASIYMKKTSDWLSPICDIPYSHTSWI